MPDAKTSASPPSSRPSASSNTDQLGLPSRAYATGPPAWYADAKATASLSGASGDVGGRPAVTAIVAGAGSRPASVTGTWWCALLACSATGPTGHGVRASWASVTKRSRGEAHRQRLQRVVEVRAHAARFADELDGREAVEELLEEDAGLQPREVHAEAEVLRDAERQVRVRVPGDVEPVGIGEDGF